MKRHLTGLNVRSDKIGAIDGKVVSVTLEFGEYIIDIEGVLSREEYRKRFGSKVDFSDLEAFLVYQITKVCEKAGFRTRD